MLTNELTLSAPVYCLRAGQIWRLERDGAALEQITHETDPVESLDVSPLNGALVYVTGNCLVLTDAIGRDRRVLLQGPALPPTADELAARNDRAVIVGRIATPFWSPDGRRIAYVQDGVNVMDVTSGESEVAYHGPFFPEYGEWIHRPAVAQLCSWSPDGRRLLLLTYELPLANLYRQQVVVQSLPGETTTLTGGSASTFGWSQDGQTLFLGSPSVGGSGALLRCTMGESCAMIGEDVPARAAFFYAYPHVVDAESIHVFVGGSPAPFQAPETYQLSRVGWNGYGRLPLRQDRQTLRDALWSPDGRGVLIITAAAAEGLPADTLVWLPVDGGPARPLPVTGAHALRWGAP